MNFMKVAAQYFKRLTIAHMWKKHLKTMKERKIVYEYGQAA